MEILRRQKCFLTHCCAHITSEVGSNRSKRSSATPKPVPNVPDIQSLRSVPDVDEIAAVQKFKLEDETNCREKFHFLDFRDARDLFAQSFCSDEA